MTEPFSTLAALPFGAQLSQIEEALQRGQARTALLVTTGRFADAEPLAYTLWRLAEVGALAAPDPELQEALRELFLTLPEANIAKVLRYAERLTGASQDANAIQVLIEAVVESIPLLPLERLAAVCFLDRWLKNVAPHKREALCQQAEATCQAAIQEKALQRLDPKTLLLVPARQVQRLSALAAEAGAEHEWRALLEAFAKKFLAILEGAPKSLSQANAEEILSRRVYTDVGHFFVELLQNAEDAQATRWIVSIQDDAVSIWHDGAPFDAKDVVGVLSIGQTTKKKGQIGFFGVGFKSVYEVSDRPQLYSGPYSFEIADISLPRRLGARPKGSPQDGTLLVLPLRDTKDPNKSAARLYQRALEVPPQTLLTLSSLKNFSVSYQDKSRDVLRLDDPNQGLVTLLQRETNQKEPYLVEVDRFTFSGGPRESTRVSETPVLLAVLLDEDNRPTPLPEGAATIFCYLPTKESSGLRFLLHAHFDLPVDRERLDLSSPWNTWALQRAGALLYRIASRSTQEKREVREALLDILPLPEELSHPAYKAIPAELLALLRESPLPLLPRADGGFVSPLDAVLVEDTSLLPLLAGLPLDREERVALAALSPRSTRLARYLGASLFGAAQLLSFLEGALQEGEPPPDWLAGQERLGVLLDALGAYSERLSLRALPVLPDEGGRLRSAPRLYRASVALRALYQDSRIFLASWLEESPSLSQRRLLQKVSPPLLCDEDLFRDLRDPIEGPMLAERGVVLWEYLSRLPSHLTEGLGVLPLFPDAQRVLKPLVGALSETILLVPTGSLGDWLRSLSRSSLSLLEPSLSAYSSFFARLGGRELDLLGVLEALSLGLIKLTVSEALSLHQIIDGMQNELTPRICQALSGARIFVDRRGRLRSLRGEEGVFIPLDEEIVMLAPEASWLSQGLCALSYLAMLGVEIKGPEAVAATLLVEDVLFDPFAKSSLLAAYAYLQKRPGALSSQRLSRLAKAPIWLDTEGEQYPLGALREKPSVAVLSALYAAWRRAPTISFEALSLAHSLGLSSVVRKPDFETLLDDLLASPPAMEEALRPLLIEALREAAAQLPRRSLLGVKQAKIFTEDSSIEAEALGSWEAPFAGGLLRAEPPLREALLYSEVPLLSLKDEEDFQELLSSLGERVASLSDLLTVLEGELSLRGSAWTSEARATARRALIGSKEQLNTQKLKEKISALPLWPTQDGRFVASSSVTRGSELARLLGTTLDTLGEEGSLLANEAEEDAEALRGIVTFLAPVELLTRRLRAEARLGEPLSSQPAFLSSSTSLARILLLLSRQSKESSFLESLPLTVDAKERLQKGKKSAATQEELTLAESLPVASELASPAWSTALRAVGVSGEVRLLINPTLSARRLLSALAEVSRQPTLASEHPLFSSKEKRQTLYQWILSRAKEIEEDAQAHGVLGKACLILAPSGTLRAPRDFVFSEEPDDLSLDWNAAEEVPEALVAWLRKVYRLEEQRLGQFVTRLLEAHEECITQRRLERSAPLLKALYKTLRAEDDTQLSQLSERFKISRTLRIESESKEITKPRKLFAPEPSRWALLCSFLQEPPERISPRYDDPCILALLRAVGARADLDVEALEALLKKKEGLKEGLDASLALARYIGLLVAEDPSLQQRLSLEKLAWLPNVEGERCAPSALYWPEPEVRSLLGERPSLFPHREFFLTVPESLKKTLRFRGASEISPEDIARRLSELSSAPLEILRWLNQALIERKIDNQWAKALFQDRPLLFDLQGELRFPRELLREEAPELFGARRGVWAEASRFPRLSDALGVPPSIGRREVLSFLGEISADLSSMGSSALLQEEPSLVSTLPRCLSFLAAKPGEVGVIPIVAEDLWGNIQLCLTNDPNLRLPEPEAALAKAKAEKKAFLFVLLPEENQEEVISLLRAANVRDLSDGTNPTKKTTQPTEGPEAEKKGLFSRLKNLFTPKEKEEQKPPKPEPPESKKPEPQEEPEEERDEKEPEEFPIRMPERGRRPSQGRRPQGDDSEPTPQEDWLRPRNMIGPQLRGAPNWVASRARTPAFGFAFAPKDLPPPYRYAPMLIAERFEPRGQRWLREALPLSWQEPARPSDVEVVFKGKIPAGESVLPLPLYGRLLDSEGAPEAKVLSTRDGQPLVRSPKEMPFSYRVALDVAPTFLEDAAPPSSPALLKKTVVDDELPPEVHSFLSTLRGAPGLVRALSIRDFIRERYRYDPSYLEDPAVARWLRQLTQGSSNAHIAALHAGRDAHHLGRGVCYELNALACELMRRAGVPAAVVTGWTLERGNATEPDHMWAVALLESDVGPRWLPIDASTTRDGRPLRVAHRPAGPWRAQSPSSRLPKAPSWMEARGRTQPRQTLPTSELLRVVQHFLSLSGQTNVDEEALATKCRELLQDPQAAKQFLEKLGV